MSARTAVHELAPTRTSTALAATVALATAGALVRPFRLVLAPTLVGAAGVVCLAAGVGLAGSDRWETPGVVLASVLSVVAGLGVLVGTAGSVLVLAGAFFPVESTAAISVRSIHLLARAGVAWGVILAVLGVALGVRNVGDDSLLGYVGLAVRTGFVPFLVGAALVAGTLLARSPLDPVEPAAALLGRLLSPPAGPTHLGSLLLLVAAATLTVRRAVAALPVAEFLADRGGGTVADSRVDRVLSRLDLAAGAAGLLMGVAFLLEGAFGRQFRGAVGPGAYRLLAAVSNASALRLALLAVIVVSAATILAVAALRLAARGSVGGFVRRVGPYAGGGVVTALALAFAGPVLTALVEGVAGRLPGPFADVFRQVTGSVVDFYGPGPLVVGLVAALAWVTAVAVLGVGVLLLMGYLTKTSVGYSLASAGLFAAAAFAGAAGVGRPLTFAGIVAALFVWDVGRYGTVLGREVGRHSPTRDVELVHAGGTLAVGAVGVLAAVALSRVLAADVVNPSTPTAVALVGAFAAVVALVAALR